MSSSNGDRTIRDQTISERGVAVVTGGAGGLGQSFARKLAMRGHRILLVDRREPELRDVCNAITAEYGVTVEPYLADLCIREQVERLAERLKQTPDVELLVNNAGFGTLNHFIDTDPNLVVGMVDLHVVAPMLLSHAVLPGMIARDRGGIINVSSVSAWFQSAGNSHYGSTKICLAAFTATLNEELRGTNVRVQALCPGFVRTQFHDAEAMKEFKRYSPTSRLWAAADDVVDFSLRRLSGRRVIVIPGLSYWAVGRLAQMPLLQPLMRRFANVPRFSSTSVPATKPRVGPVVGVDGGNC